MSEYYSGDTLSIHRPQIFRDIMARMSNLPAKKYTAGNRTERILRFAWDAGDGNSTQTTYIDLAKALSMVNRRAYRQGLYYYVAKVSFSNNTEAYCQVNTLPDNWMTKAAWLRGFRKWNKMNSLAANGSADMIYPKYHDFKVSMVQGAVPAPPLHGMIGATDAYLADDWVMSEFVTQDPYLHGGAASDTPVEAFNADQFQAHMLGPHTGSSGAWSSIGLIESYQDVHPTQASTGVPTISSDMDTDPLGNLFDSADTFDDIRLNMDEDNDEPPYNHDEFVGRAVTETVPRAIIRTSAGAGAISSAPGFCAPLGLLQVNVSDFSAGTVVGDVELFVELVPGTYNGVYAERVA